MKNFDTRVYNISDFVEWNQRSQLELSPKFQRRGVWTTKAKSYLVDTIIRGKPIPKLLLLQDVQDRKNTRTVVDGQQRLRAILEYVAGAFPISRAHNRDYAGFYFESLPISTQTDFLKYEIGVDLLYDVPYKDVLDIFARLNTYTVTLNKQELLNAKYVGYFKQLAYELGFEYAEFLISAGVLTDAQVTRMAEADMASDLLVSLIDEVQSNKNIESFYKMYDDDLPNIDQIRDRFHSIMGVIGEVYNPEDLKKTNWSRVHLFYTLFTTIGHGLYGLRGVNAKFRPPTSQKYAAKTRAALDGLSASYDEYSAMLPDTKGIPPDFAEFIQKSRRATTDTGARVYRTDFLSRKLSEAS